MIAGEAFKQNSDCLKAWRASRATLHHVLAGARQAGGPAGSRRSDGHPRPSLPDSKLFRARRKPAGGTWSHARFLEDKWQLAQISDVAARLSIGVL